jgi:hypothetical protein
MNPTRVLSSGFVSQLDELAQDTQFSSGVPAASSPEAPAPQGSLLWRSPYAVLLATPAPQKTPEEVLTAARTGTAWLSVFIQDKEEKGLPLDGYLLIALDEKPEDADLELIRGITLDTSVCRKHVAWPDERGSWLSTLYGVTVVGLPEPIFGKPLTSTQIPELPPAAERALALYRKTSNYDLAAEQLTRELIEGADPNVD